MLSEKPATGLNLLAARKPPETPSPVILAALNSRRVFLMTALRKLRLSYIATAAYSSARSGISKVYRSKMRHLAVSFRCFFPELIAAL